MASRQLRLCFLCLTVKLQLCSWWWYNQRYHFFSLLKHTCLIIFSIDFLTQPPDLNEVFRLVYDILILHCFCQKVSWRIMPEHYNTNSPFEGLRGQLCWGFAGGLQLSRKVLTQAAYAIYRAVIQSYLTACVQFSRYVAKLIMNSTVNGSSGSWSCFDFTALKIGGTVAFCLIIIISLVANSLIVILVCKTPNLKKPINYFIANMALSDLLYPIFVMPSSLSYLHTSNLFLIGGQLGQALCKLAPFFGAVSLTVSIQNLILIAVDRFGAVVFPLRSPLIRSKLCPFFILTTWIVAVAFNSPDLFSYELVEYPEGTRCVPKWKKAFREPSSFASFIIAFYLLFIYIPVLLLVITPSLLSSSRHRHTQVNSPPTLSNSGTEETETCFKCPLLS